MMAKSAPCVHGYDLQLFIAQKTMNQFGKYVKLVLDTEISGHGINCFGQGDEKIC